MRALPVGWATDLAVLEHSGSTVEEHDDHVVVRSPRNPTFHWGNCVLVTNPDSVDDAQRWAAVFEAAFPSATWVAIGLAQMPRDTAAWAERGLELELDDVLSTDALPRQTPLPAGYAVRRLDGDDWDQVLAGELAENHRTGEYEPQSHERFVRARMQIQRSLSERETGAFFGAFSEGVLAGHLGIVRCGETARYQDVGTDARHRRRGLASHLLGVAARWAAGHGCARWVIITEATNPAGRVYRSVGFETDVANAQAYRPPPR
jgi:GNAT superfamily N-acetyltransferase